ncbi:MAG: sigma-70 family RNA polymerase sigma factor [Deltaproteobacteria bacterium]|nr:sigma-70 family RNA polymerase sigma factor [Deltaproteobacteria bacterium]
MNPVSEEATLARAAAAGDRRAFTRLVELTKRPVHGLCLRLLGDAEEARDAAQESFVRAWAALQSYDPGQPFAPWLLRIARNHCIDLIRRRLPAAQRVELDAERGDGERPVEIPDPTAGRGDEAVERAQTTSALEEAVTRLPERYREVVHLFHVEQMSYKEIAATMEIPMGTVMTWLHRARAQLRTELQGRDA